jgi:dienelactone hydrolase
MNNLTFYALSIFIALSSSAFALSPDWLTDPPEDLPTVLQGLPPEEIAQRFQEAAIKLSLGKRKILQKTKDPVFHPEVDYYAIALQALNLDFNGENDNANLIAYIQFLRRIKSDNEFRKAELYQSKNIIFTAIEIVIKKWQLIGCKKYYCTIFYNFLKPYLKEITIDPDLSRRLAFLINDSLNNEDEKIYQNFFLFLTTEVRQAIKTLEQQPRKISRYPKVTPDEQAFYCTSSNPNLTKEYSAIFNNDGFLSPNQTPTRNHEFFIGNPIEINGIKTGYNIIFPEQITKESKIFVEVYGGFGPDDPEGFDFTVDNTHRPWRSLLENGMVVVSLNLPDRLELEGHQAQMPLRLYSSLHTAINNFVETIKTNPSSLLAGLDASPQILQKLQMLTEFDRYIYGASFGGGVAMRHLQIYPDDFKGAISFNGALTNSFGSPTMNDYFAPDNFLDEKHCLRALIMFNQDDFNVSPLGNLKFAGDAHDKLSCISLHATARGNPASFEEEIVYRGHGHNSFSAFYDRSIEAILRFMNHEPEPVDTMTALGWYENLYCNDFTAFFSELILSNKYDSQTLLVKLWNFYNHYFFGVHSKKADLSRFCKESFTKSKVIEYLQSSNATAKDLLSESEKMTWQIIKELFLSRADKDIRLNIKEYWLNSLSSSQLVHNHDGVATLLNAKLERVLKNICHNTCFAPYEYSQDERAIVIACFGEEITALLDASANIALADRNIGFEYEQIQALREELDNF